MLTPTTPRRSRYAPSVVTKNDLLELLNADFTRECRAIYAHAAFAERFKDSDEAASAAVTRAGQQTVLASLALCQLIYDYGGSVANNLDEPRAVRGPNDG